MNGSDLAALLRERVLVFDGPMGTMLSASARDGWCPDEANLREPDAVEAVHRAYLAAGADIIQTNTFGANELKLSLYGLDRQAAGINSAAATAARRAAASVGRPVWVAGCIGPTGRLLKPFGEWDPRSCYEAFLAQAIALAEAGVDAFNIETMSDILEAKLAVIAARTAAPELAILCSLTFEGGERTLTGTDPQSAAVLLEALGVTVIGTNCGGGPAETALANARLAAATSRPLIARPNAGLPEATPEGRTIWTLTPPEIEPWAERYLADGAAIVGGCCGTTPEHIAVIRKVADGARPSERRAPGQACSRLSGVGSTVASGPDQPIRVAGERLNPTARPDLQQALAAGDWDFVASEALAQAAAGADLIDINVAYPVAGLSEADLMEHAVLAVQKAVGVPVSLDSTNAEALERGLSVCRGKALLNSTTADPEQLVALLGLAVRYGAAIVGLPMAGGKVPRTADARIDLARRIVTAAGESGLPPGDVYIDGLVMAASVHAKLAGVALETVRRAGQELGVCTMLGLSNVSHGLPARDHLNAAYLAMAAANGIDLVIANPAAPVLGGIMRASGVLTGRDPHAKSYIAWAAGSGVTGQPQQAEDQRRSASEASAAGLPAALQEAVRTGDSYTARELALNMLRSGRAGLDVISASIIPGLEDIGREYEAKRAYLPQLLLAAEAAQAAFGVIEQQEQAATDADPTRRRQKAGKVVIATVKGDMHDIGKGIVSLMLASHGFEVIDLGRDVGADAVVTSVREHRPDIVALSALMTTTMPEMGRTVDALRQAGERVPVLIGGAVVTEAYAASIGATYAADAVAGVRAAKRLAGG